jgi:hypothetical protein
MRLRGCCVIRHSSHLAPHTSHLTPHTSHLTHNTSHTTPHTQHLTHVRGDAIAEVKKTLGMQVVELHRELQLVTNEKEVSVCDAHACHP